MGEILKRLPYRLAVQLRRSGRRTAASLGLLLGVAVWAALPHPEPAPAPRAAGSTTGIPVSRCYELPKDEQGYGPYDKVIGVAYQKGLRYVASDPTNTIHFWSLTQGAEAVGYLIHTDQNGCVSEIE